MKSAVCILLLFFQQNICESIQCYSCNSKQEPTCMEADKLDSFKTECSSKAVEDGKKAFNSVTSIMNDLGLSKSPAIEGEFICQKVDLEAKDQKYTVRSCYFGKKDSDSGCDIVKKVTSDSVKVTHCSQCTDNLCNSSSNVSPTLFSIFITLAAVHLYCK